jgi:hypothetical protein
VDLTLSSDLLVFARARALMLRQDNPEAFLAESESVDNVISNLNISEPAQYSLWLSDIEAKISSTGESIRLTQLLLPWNIEFTREDLDHGKKTFVVPSDGVFRVTVVDQLCKPIPRHKLMAYSFETINKTSIECTIHFQMDENGTMTTYGNPTRCLILPEAGIGVLIQHLDTAAI